jgi:hypothetical protein
MVYKEIAPGTFLDTHTKGAFDRIIELTEAAERHGVGSTIVRRINTMLESRIIIATLSEETLEVSVTRDCPQGRPARAPPVKPGDGRVSWGTQ